MTAGPSARGPAIPLYPYQKRWVEDAALTEAREALKRAGWSLHGAI